MELARQHFKRACLHLITITTLLLLVSGSTGIVMADESRANLLKRVYELYATYRADNFPEVEEISATEAIQLASQDRVQFIDARTKSEMAVSVLPGAVSHGQFLENRQYAHNKVAVVYCTISYRSGVLAKGLKADGLSVKNLQGGLLAWIHEGGKMYNDDKPTNRVHVYGPKWDLAPSTYETRTFSYWQRLKSGS